MIYLIVYTDHVMSRVLIFNPYCTYHVVSVLMAAKERRTVRIKTSSKGNRWRKGQSGLSNPQTAKHRNAAKGKFGTHLAQVTNNGAKTQ